jgi:CRISPR-associated endonuclease Cas1
MAASATVSQFPQPRNLLTPRHGVLTLYGYGIKVYVDRGHLIVKDGVGSDRHEARLPRVGHGLRRLVLIGTDGFVSLPALRWLADQDIAFVMLERNGSVLAATGPVRPSDARLRRAQALAGTNGKALEISKGLLRQKLTAQEQLTRHKLNDFRAADLIAANHEAINEAQTIEALRLSESRGAYAYWSAWRDVPVMFPKRDLPRIPGHWRRFGARISPLTGSPRLATNPLNAMLNYLYAILEAEACLAANAMGLDPGIGLMHVDTDARDSFACDLMEPVRPQVDAYVLEWVSREPLRKEWFFEQRNGNCRLMASFAAQLSETAPTWGRAVAPVAEWVATEVWSTVKKPTRSQRPATRLTQGHKREAKGILDIPANTPPKRRRICLGCGGQIVYGKNFCSSCGVVIARDELIEAAKRGRIAAQSSEAQARRAETQRQNRAQQVAWKASNLPAWLDEDTYTQKIQPRLKTVSLRSLMLALNICESYAANIRAGRRRPHPRHWETLAQLVGLCRAG